jgi:hypothetical protein
MRPGEKSFLGVSLVASALLLVAMGPGRSWGDEPSPSTSRLGRLFRFGGGASSGSSATSPAASATPSNPTPTGTSTDAAGDPSQSASALSPGFSSPTATNILTTTGSPANPPRIVPRPRVSRPVTESDPIVTRITLNRSDEGNSFGMFLQVFADGTVIDSEGVHHVGRDALKPIIEALEAGEIYRQKGHCGAPATDFVESVHIVVFERVLGRLRANSFSYSGNPQGCDNSVRHLHATLDNLQSKLFRTAPTTTPAPPAIGDGGPAFAPPAIGPALPAPSVGQTVIPLTAPN